MISSAGKQGLLASNVRDWLMTCSYRISSFHKKSQVYLNPAVTQPGKTSTRWAKELLLRPTHAWRIAPTSPIFIPPLPFCPLSSCQTFLATHFCTDWLSHLGLVTRCAQLLITSKYYLPSVPKPKSLNNCTRLSYLSSLMFTNECRVGWVQNNNWDSSAMFHSNTGWSRPSTRVNVLKFATWTSSPEVRQLNKLNSSRERVPFESRST